MSCAVQAEFACEHRAQADITLCFSARSCAVFWHLFASAAAAYHASQIKQKGVEKTNGCYRRGVQAAINSCASACCRHCSCATVRQGLRILHMLARSFRQAARYVDMQVEAGLQEATQRERHGADLFAAKDTDLFFEDKVGGRTVCDALCISSCLHMSWTSDDTCDCLHACLIGGSIRAGTRA